MTSPLPILHRFEVQPLERLPVSYVGAVVEIGITKWPHFPSRALNEVENWAVSSVILGFLSGDISKQELIDEQINIRIISSSGEVLLDTLVFPFAQLANET